MTPRTDTDTADTQRLQAHHTLSAIVVAALPLATSGLAPLLPLDCRLPQLDE